MFVVFFFRIRVKEKFNNLDKTHELSIGVFMKLICSILILMSFSSFAQVMYTEQDILNNRMAPFPQRLPLTDKSEKRFFEECTGKCSTSNIMDVFELRNKYFNAVNTAYYAFNDLKVDDPNRAKVKLEYYEATIKFLEADAKLKSLQLEHLQKKAIEAEQAVAQCKADVAEKESLTVNDSNRSFFKKVSDILSWKRDIPAPVEERSTGTSK
jgi:hypothetical protein